MKGRPAMGARRSLIAVMGNSVVPDGDIRLSLAEQLGAALVESGYRVLCGGRGGIMEAVCRGAKETANTFEGATVAILPSGRTQDANPYVDVSLATGIGLSRNSLVAHADAAIGLGGGAGTLSEMAYAWQFNRLLVGMRVEGWSGKLADKPIDERVRFPSITDDCCFGATTAVEAVAIINERLSTYLELGQDTQWR